MNILVINTGSSSLKYQLFDMEKDRVLTKGIVERIGEPEGIFTYTDNGKEKVEKHPIPDHHAAMLLVAGHIDAGISAVGHRVVQGGETFKAATRIDDAVKAAIRENNSLAPLHNPANLVGIQVAEQLFPGIPQVAVFDTNFHQDIPQKAYLYALPFEYYTDYKVRKYGFHGTSHKYVAQRTAALMGRSFDDVNLITLHLGNGCSISAVQNGKCRDTSMGMTPLAGVMMGTRSGDFDPAVFGYLLDQTGMDRDELDRVLNKNSGLKGICGLNDLRDIHERANQGDRMAVLAVEMFAYQIKRYIGTYAAVLGHVDALVFTAGVGENDSIIREKALADLSVLGIDIDPEKNRDKSRQARSIHSQASRIQVWVVPTNEELQIALETRQVLESPGN